MKKKVLCLISIIFTMMISVTALAKYTNDPQPLGTNVNNYSYSPVGDRCVMYAIGNPTTTYTRTMYQTNPNLPTFQFLYAYVGERVNQTVLHMQVKYDSCVRGYSVQTANLARNKAQSGYNYYHVSKCFNCGTYTSDPAIGMVNLVDELIVRVNQ